MNRLLRRKNAIYLLALGNLARNNFALADDSPPYPHKTSHIIIMIKLSSALNLLSYLSLWVLRERDDYGAL